MVNQAYEKPLRRISTLTLGHADRFIARCYPPPEIRESNFFELWRKPFQTSISEVIDIVISTRIYNVLRPNGSRGKNWYSINRCLRKRPFWVSSVYLGNTNCVVIVTLFIYVENISVRNVRFFSKICLLWLQREWAEQFYRTQEKLIFRYLTQLLGSNKLLKIDIKL